MPLQTVRWKKFCKMPLHWNWSFKASKKINHKHIKVVHTSYKTYDGFVWWADQIFPSSELLKEKFTRKNENSVINYPFLNFDQIIESVSWMW